MAERTATELLATAVDGADDRTPEWTERGRTPVNNSGTLYLTYSNSASKLHGVDGNTPVDVHVFDSALVILPQDTEDNGSA